MAHELDHRRHEVGAGGDASEKEVADDPPSPFGIGNEMIHEATSGVEGFGGDVLGTVGSPLAAKVFLAPLPSTRVSGCVRLRKANSTPSAVRMEAKIPQNAESGTLRLGIFGADGRP